MKRSRTVNEAFPPRFNAKGKKLCRYCVRRLLKGRKRSWCSWKCAEQAYIRCNPGNMRFYVWERDKGQCKSCGFNISKMEEELRQYRAKARLGTAYYEGIKATKRYAKHLYGVRAGNYPEGHLWEADHLVPISEAGDPFDPQNVRVLCLKCHKEETAKLRKRLAIRRKRHSFKPLFPEELLPA